MSGVLGVAARLALGVWAGALVFFSLAAAPAIFARLPREEAGRAVAAIFPAYYLTGWIAGGVAAAAILAGERPSRRRRWRVTLLGLALVASLYGGLVLLPQVRAARAAGDEAGRRRAHAVAVALNVVTTAAVLGALALSPDGPPEKPRP